MLAAVLLWPFVYRAGEWLDGLKAKASGPGAVYDSAILISIHDGNRTSWIKYATEGWDPIRPPDVPEPDQDAFYCYLSHGDRVETKAWFTFRHRRMWTKPVWWYSKDAERWISLIASAYDPSLLPTDGHLRLWLDALDRHAVRYALHRHERDWSDNSSRMTSMNGPWYADRVGIRFRQELLLPVLTTGALLGIFAPIATGYGVRGWRWMKVRFVPQGCCVGCGYRLGGLHVGAPCPECGRAQEVG